MENTKLPPPAAVDTLSVTVGERPYAGLVTRILNSSSLTGDDKELLLYLCAEQNHVRIAMTVDQHIKLGAPKSRDPDRGAFGIAAKAHGCGPTTARKAYQNLFVNRRAASSILGGEYDGQEHPIVKHEVPEWVAPKWDGHEPVPVGEE